MPVNCNTYKTLQVSFLPPSIPPANGYRVKYRVVGEEEWIATPNQFNNPVTLAGIPACFNLEVSIQADCGGGNLGPANVVGVTGTVTACYEFELINSALYTYVPCGQTEPVNLTVLAESPVVVCAVDGTVSGGFFVRQSICFE